MAGLRTVTLFSCFILNVMVKFLFVSNTVLVANYLSAKQHDVHTKVGRKKH